MKIKSYGKLVVLAFTAILLAVALTACDLGAGEIASAGTSHPGEASISTDEWQFEGLGFNSLQDLIEPLEIIGLTLLNAEPVTEPVIFSEQTAENYSDWHLSAPIITRLSSDIPIRFSSKYDVDLLMEVARLAIGGFSWDSCVDDALIDAGFYDYWETRNMQLERLWRDRLSITGAIDADSMDFTGFLSLLEESGFEIEELGRNEDSWLSADAWITLGIGDEQLTIFEFNIRAEMQIASSWIDTSGFLISRPDHDGEDSIVDEISFVSYPYWFKSGNIIILYVGENEGIIGFLRETFGHNFAGYQAISRTDNQDPTITLTDLLPNGSERTFYLENMTEYDRIERMSSITLFSDGTATIENALVVSVLVPRSPDAVFTIDGTELIVSANFEWLENGNEIARFSIVNNDTLELLSAVPPIIASAGTRFVYSPNAPEFFTDSGAEQFDLDADARVDLRSLIRRDLDDVRHLLGTQTGTNDGVGMHYTYYFEGGLAVSVGEIINNIVEIDIIFDQADTASRFHFEGFDNTSTYDDVIARFGNDPFDIRADRSEEMIGAVKSYGYWFSANEFIRFSFDSDGNVVAISYFLAEMPPDAAETFN